MIGIEYFIVIVVANTVGAISGMGGGVIIKPVFDLIGHHPLPAISFYSAVAVFVMALVSTLRQIKNKVAVKLIIATFLSFGSIIGGVLGNITFDYLIAVIQNNDLVELIQIIITFITLLFALLYSIYNKVHFKLTNLFWYLLVGSILGYLASLLGIGGGPINVALLMLCFSIPIKEATVYSIITIFFSQLAKLITIEAVTGFNSFDLTMLLYIVPAAIIGGFMGAKLSGILPSSKVTIVYRTLIVIVLLINVYNGIRIFI